MKKQYTKPTVTKIDNFRDYLQRDCGGYTLREILDNLEEDQIIEAVDEYCKSNLRQQDKST